MGTTIREFITRWGFDVDDSDLKKLNQGVSNVEKGLRNASKRAIGLGKTLSVGVTLPIVGIGVAAIKAASDFEESSSKFNTVFSDLRDESSATAKQLAKDFGLSRGQATQLLGDTGDLLTGFGFTQESALDLSKQVNELAVDLASFTNFSGGAEGASQALTKALLGERESIKSLGISILEEDVKKQVQINSTKGLTFETERQAKAFATLQLAQKQSKNAIGDFARTSDGFANQTRILRAELGDLAVEFGKILLPVAQSLVSTVRSMVGFFQELSPAVKTTIVVIAGLAAALGPVLIVSGLLINSILALRTAFTLLQIAGLRSLLTLALPFLKIIALGALIGLVVEDIIGFFQGKDSVTGIIVEEFKKAFDFLEEQFMRMGTLGQIVVTALLTPLRAVIATVRGIGGAVGALVSGDFKLAGEALAGIAKDAFAPVGDLISGGGTSLSSALGFGSSQPTVNPSAAAVAGASNTTTTQSINAPINISVPEGTTPDQVGPAVQKGISDGLSNLLRQTQRQTTTPVVN